MKRSLVLAFCALAIMACGEAADDRSVSHEAPPTSADLRVAGQTIINGSAPDQPYHDAVVSLSIIKGARGYICSGTVIAPDVVLTAAHCLDGANGGPNFSTLEPSAFQVRVGDSFYAPDATYGVVEAVIHPSYDRRALLNDIGLLRTASPVALDPVPALPASLGFTEADIGTVINFAGFGLDENDALGVKLQADGILGGLGCTVYGCPSWGDSVVDTQISYDQSSGPCSGDSGGPAFVFRGGDVYVGGVTSYGDANCTVYGASTRVDAFEAWIDAFVGSPPVCGDGTCNGTEDCSSCTADCGACPYCGDGTCDDTEDCSSCTADCGACPYCGDGVCSPDESCADCAGDCGECPACGLEGDACSSNADCCFGKCRGKPGVRSCR